MSIEVFQKDTGFGGPVEACREKMGNILWVSWGIEVQQRERRSPDGDGCLQEGVTSVKYCTADLPRRTYVTHLRRVDTGEERSNPGVPRGRPRLASFHGSCSSRARH
jgi:hypothetical protein